MARQAAETDESQKELQLGGRPVGSELCVTRLKIQEDKRKNLITHFFNKDLGNVYYRLGTRKQNGGKYSCSLGFVSFGDTSIYVHCFFAHFSIRLQFHQVVILEITTQLWESDYKQVSK